MQLDHIAIIVSKEENLEFYKKLGFSEQQRFERHHDTVVFMEQDGVVLEVFIDSKHPERITNPEAKGLRHIAFQVDDFEKTVTEFECEPIRKISSENGLRLRRILMDSRLRLKKAADK